MLRPFEKPVLEIELFLRLFLTVGGGW